MGTMFTNLKFPFTEVEGTFHVNVPARRPDITISEDLVEEVGRLYGYDHIPVTLPSGTMTRGKLTSAQTKRRKVRRFLEGAGLYEAITYSLTSADKAKQYMVEPNEKAPVGLALPMSEERSQLRLSLVPQLLKQFHTMSLVKRQRCFIRSRFYLLTDRRRRTSERRTTSCRCYDRSCSSPCMAR